MLGHRYTPGNSKSDELPRMGTICKILFEYTHIGIVYAKVYYTFRRNAKKLDKYVVTKQISVTIWP